MKYLLFLLLITSSLTYSSEAPYEVGDKLVKTLVFESKLKCSDGYEKSPELNGFNLFGAAINCGKEKKDFEATLLLLLGQIRSMTDMTVLKAANDEDEVIQASLYGVIYNPLGGSGPPELYRNEQSKNRLFDEIKKWKPTPSSEYDPGWNYKNYSKIDMYNETLKIFKYYRIQQLDSYSYLINNDEYYDLQKKFSELQAKNPKGFVVGTDAYKESQALTKKMREISANAPKVKIKDEKPFEFEPAPDAEYKQVFVGFNGPRKGENYIWESEVGARRSWLSSALDEKELENIFSEIDFNKQILIGFAVGERPNVTGRIYITNASYNTIYESYSISGAVGVTDQDCKEEFKNSYAFAIAIAKKPPEVPLHPSYSIQNFPDKCQPIKSGEPNG